MPIDQTASGATYGGIGAIVYGRAIDAGKSITEADEEAFHAIMDERDEWDRLKRMEEQKKAMAEAAPEVQPDYLMPTPPKWWHIAKYFHFS